METTSDELLRIARRCADKLTPSKLGLLPALEDIEDACGDEVEEMLAVLQDPEVFGAVDLNEQQKIADQIEASLPADRRALVAELSDKHTEHLWLQQLVAYHLGIAIGMRLGEEGSDKEKRKSEEQEE